MTTELLDELEGVVSDVLERHGNGAWAALGDLGFLGLEVAEEHGGGGMRFPQLAALLRPAGRTLSGLPLLSSVVLGAAAIGVAGSPEQRREHLPALAAGQTRVAVALGPGVRRDGQRLRGATRHVLDAAGADAVVIAVDTPDGIALALVQTDAPGVRIEEVPTHDLTRRLAAVHLDQVTDDDFELLPHGDPVEVIGWLEDRAAVALSIDSSAGARRVLDLTVEYAKQREQFGRPIGSFQAIKHQLADMFVAVETADVAARAAVRDLPQTPDERSRWAAIAKPHTTDAYAEVAGTGVFIHGGIGFTWEHDLHRFLKRAKLNRALFGSPAAHRERHAAMLLDRAEAQR